jgi:hypothetical protein
METNLVDRICKVLLTEKSGANLSYIFKFKNGTYRVYAFGYDLMSGMAPITSMHHYLRIIKERPLPSEKWTIYPDRYEWISGRETKDRWASPINSTQTIEDLLREIWMSIL